MMGEPAGASQRPGRFANVPPVAAKTSGETGPVLSIGALSRATGVPVETLRTWERRYGVPRARRRSSGHRVYPLDDVAHLRRVVRALELGHRPSQVLRLADADLEALLDAAQGMVVPSAAPAPRTARVARSKAARTAAGRAGSMERELMDAVTAFDSSAFQSALELALLRRTRVAFLEEVAAPFMTRVGRAVERGALDIRHEHFAAGVTGDLLRGLRRRVETPRPSRHVALGLLPGHAHELGLLMAALVFADQGWGIVYLGPETPVEQFVSLAADTQLDAVAISVASTGAGAATTAALRRVREGLPAGTMLVVGGAGAPARLSGAHAFHDLRSLERWLQGRR